MTIIGNLLVPETVVVSSCMDCPCVGYNDELMGIEVCQLHEDELELPENHGETGAPNWCPLRTAAIALAFEE